ncbi:unnamed protein product [Ceratitis capitata]|uniref:(Mediterranean fruit fly) hypothetical protein n=1 Tax=Ceratitis capitata TaxID=7213 RepID=A0A811UQE7_CERCA|nr:unnamed protein product [Ceratitis capitata]
MGYSELKLLWAEVKTEYRACLSNANALDASDGSTIETIKLRCTDCYNAYVCSAALMNERIHNITAFQQKSNSTVIYPELISEVQLMPSTEVFYGE